jgi:radical SAM protein with 4Fe4S-binding SPASM domain
MHKISLMIETTNRCNLKCTTCFSHQDGRGKVDMTLKSFIKLINSNADHINQISLYNYGEPLLNRSTFGMIRYAKKMGIKYVKLATNGTLLNDQKAAALVNSGLDLVSISLDGASAVTYTKFRVGGNFGLVVKNIGRLVAIRNQAGTAPEIELQFIIMNHNEHEIADIKALAKKLGVDKLRLKTVLVKKAKWNYLLPKDDDYNRYAGAKELKTCSRPIDELVVNSDGTVIPCCYVVGRDVEKYRLGNIARQTIEEIRKSGVYSSFAGNCLSDKGLNPCCKNCNEGNLQLNYKVMDLSGRS